MLYFIHTIIFKLHGIEKEIIKKYEDLRPAEDNSAGFSGKVAATLFTGGCNFRCPFCHNSGLLSGDAEELYTPGEILRFLEKRKNILEGVCITGGEPTLQPDLADFIRDIRSLGLAVKLDTNGYRPDILEEPSADMGFWTMWLWT